MGDTFGIALGSKAYDEGHHNIAIGRGANARGLYATAIGENINAFGDHASAFGDHAWRYCDVFANILRGNPEHVTPRRLEMLEELKIMVSRHPNDEQYTFLDFYPGVKVWS